ncbi:hypothetical protein [uncultured Paracoccus sp.]|uniref:hypothetical protein n=1 Tax=uncultured Paracoccus sp. TaxID=189685 RepID=UPI0025E074FD|nr:hypothetical protein [uncultured Paracoccus sp.]
MAEPQEKSNTGIIIGVVVVVVIALAWFFMSGSGGDDATTVETPAADAPMAPEGDPALPADPVPGADGVVDPATDPAADPLADPAPVEPAPAN